MPWFKLVAQDPQISQFIPYCGKPQPLKEHPGMSFFSWEAARIQPEILSSIHQANYHGQTCFYWQPKAYQAIFFDMDSTVIAQESIVELARFAGTADEVERITELAMEGQLDFNQALEQRVATLAGQDESILEQVSQRLSINPGLPEACRFALERNINLYLVSGGFHELAQYIGEQLSFHGYRANFLDRMDGKLSGKLSGKIINANEKLNYVKEVCREKSFSAETIVAIGDGANDLLMLSYAGLALGYRPKSVLIPHLNGAIFDSFAILKPVFSDGS